LFQSKKRFTSPINFFFSSSQLNRKNIKILLHFEGQSHSTSKDEKRRKKNQKWKQFDKREKKGKNCFQIYFTKKKRNHVFSIDGSQSWIVVCRYVVFDVKLTLLVSHASGRSSGRHFDLGSHFCVRQQNSRLVFIKTSGLTQFHKSFLQIGNQKWKIEIHKKPSRTLKKIFFFCWGKPFFLSCMR
jgi:hypothetical protein